LPLNMPEEKLRTLKAIAEALQNVSDVAAVVLGGSYARGFARPDSDIDIGIYYREASPFSVDQVRSVADGFCTVGSVPIVTGMYEWGPWVNGGAWIQTPAGKVDLLYRNLDQVQVVIDEGRQGEWCHDYDQQPPYGAEFSLRFWRTFANSADVYNTVGCLTRVAQFLAHALFAINGEYFVSDKYASRLIEQFALRPHDFTMRLERVLSNPGDGPTELRRSYELLSVLWLETVELTAGRYKPRFDLKACLP